MKARKGCVGPGEVSELPEDWTVGLACPDPDSDLDFVSLPVLDSEAN